MNEKMSEIKALITWIRSYGLKKINDKGKDIIVEALEKQIPKKPRIDYNGVIHKEHCPNCNRSLFPNEHHCECGQRIDFEEEIPNDSK